MRARRILSLGLARRAMACLALGRMLEAEVLHHDRTVQGTMMVVRNSGTGEEMVVVAVGAGTMVVATAEVEIEVAVAEAGTEIAMEVAMVDAAEEAVAVGGALAGTDTNAGSLYTLFSLLATTRLQVDWFRVLSSIPSCMCCTPFILTAAVTFLEVKTR